MKEEKLILVTNDDGYDSKGLWRPSRSRGPSAAWWSWHPRRRRAA
ncbi:MAG: hypothetical protein ACLT1W_15335 [Alistipes onderdonkii]